MLVYSYFMNNLKKALTRDDPKKYQKSKIEISGFKKNSQWDQVEWIMQKKAQKRNTENNIEESFRTIVEGSFANGQLRDVSKLFKELKDKYKEFHADSSISSENARGIFILLRKMLEREDGTLLRKYLSVAIEKLEAHLKERKNKEKEKCLGEFNKLLNAFKPPKASREEKTQPMSKLPHSTSATNLRIRVTKEEYQFEQDEPAIKRKKSLDFKNKSKASSHKEGEATNKLQMFLKESNMKLVKTKIEYDYSAIFEASKSNIQSRNKTTVFEPKSQKEVITKATNGKKNQGFVFYRPTAKK